MSYLTLKEINVNNFNYQYIHKTNAVACLITAKIHGNTFVLVTNQFRIGPFVKSNRHQLAEIPAGNIDKDETYFQAVKREVFEETGLDIPITNFRYLGEIYSSPGWTTEKIYLFHTKLETVPVTQLFTGNSAEHEKIHISWISIETLQLLQDPKLFSAVFLAQQKHLI